MNHHWEWSVIIPASLLGIAGSLAGWLHELMHGRRKLALLDFLSVMFIGGFLGIMGDQIAMGLDLPLLRGVIAGALAVTGLRGFDILSRKMMGGGP